MLTAASPLEQIVRLLTETPCLHCGRSPYRADRPAALVGPAASGTSPAGTGADPEAIDEDERWLWEVVEDAERVRRAAPEEPEPDELPAARRELTAALGVQRRVAELTALTWAALNRPGSWLRPRHRVRLVRALHRQQEAAAAAAAQVDRARRSVTALERRREHRRSYLARHRDTLEAGVNAQAELDRRIDELIDGYARRPDPPAWFRYGLGYPPSPEEYPQWLHRARQAVIQRRRYRVDNPVELRRAPGTAPEPRQPGGR